MIHVTKHDDEIVVIRPGAERLTAVNAPVFREEVVALVSGGATHLIVDFRDVSFLDSSGLGALTSVLKRIGHRGDMAICGLASDIGQMFRMCRMDRVFKIYRDVDLAVQNMREAR